MQGFRGDGQGKPGMDSIAEGVEKEETQKEKGTTERER